MSEMKRLVINGISYEVADKQARVLANAAIPSSEKGVANGVATLDGNGKIVSGQLPTMGALASKDEISVDNLDETTNNLVMRGAVASIALGDFIQYSEADGYSADYVKEYIDSKDTALSNRLATLTEQVTAIEKSKARIIVSETRPEDLSSNDVWMKILD